MDVWHWTSLVVLLAYAGLVVDPRRLLPGRARSTARRPWAVFRYIQLPKMKRVLTIAVLLRFMDSFMIYTEAVGADRRRARATRRRCCRSTWSRSRSASSTSARRRRCR